MRLWHKDLIGVLPDNQLMGQWRECCLIAKSLADGTLNHLLVNKVKYYPKEHFKEYTERVIQECKKRGIGIRENVFYQHFARWVQLDNDVRFNSDVMFGEWHNYRYLKQCYYNLQEKYDCGGFGEIDFGKLASRYIWLGGRL